MDTTRRSEGASAAAADVGMGALYAEIERLQSQCLYCDGTGDGARDGDSCRECDGTGKDQ